MQQMTLALSTERPKASVEHLRRRDVQADVSSSNSIRETHHGCQRDPIARLVITPKFPNAVGVLQLVRDSPLECNQVQALSLNVAKRLAPETTNKQSSQSKSKVFDSVCKPPIAPADWTRWHADFAFGEFKIRNRSMAVLLLDLMIERWLVYSMSKGSMSTTYCTSSLSGILNRSVARRMVAPSCSGSKHCSKM